MGTIYISRRETFSAAHRLYVEEWSDAKNMEVFGKCSNPNWHGHNYVLRVTVKGDVMQDTGFVMNLRILSQLIKDEILDQVDHKNLNLDVDFMQGIQPSTENIAVAIWNLLDAKVKNYGATLHEVEIGETEKNSVRYLG